MRKLGSNSSYGKFKSRKTKIWAPNNYERSLAARNKAETLCYLEFVKLIKTANKIMQLAAKSRGFKIK